LSEGALPPVIMSGASTLEHLPPFPVSLTVPTGWTQAVTRGDLTFLMHQELGAVVFLHAGIYGRFEPLLGRLAAILDQFVENAYPVGEPDHGDIEGTPAMVVAFHGKARSGDEIAIQVCVLLSPEGLGAVVGGIAPLDSADAIIRDVNQLAASVRFGALDENPELRGPLVGTWRHEDGPAFAFRPDGSFHFTAPGEGEVGGRFLVLGGHLVLAGEDGSSAQTLAVTPDRLTIGDAEYHRAGS